MKTIVRPSFAAFFNAGPSLAFPVVDGLLVALQRTSRKTVRQLGSRPTTGIPASIKAQGYGISMRIMAFESCKTIEIHLAVRGG
jgi:hypothetical protein